MQKKHTIIHLIILALLAMTTTQALGQSTDLNNLQSYIERNAELLHEAEALVSQTNSVKARLSLQAAVKLHQATLRAVDDVRPALAVATARKAREAILRTLAIAKRDAKLETDVLKAIERATQRLEQAGDALGESDAPNPNVRRLLEEAQQQLQKSRTSYQQHLLEIAFRFAKTSAELSTRAAAMLKRDNAGVDRVRAELQRTDDLINRISEQLDDQRRPRAAEMLAEASRIQQRAKENAQSENYRAALEMTERARQMAARIPRLLSGDGASPDDVQRYITLTDELIQRAQDAVESSPNDAAAAKLAEAKRAQDGAKDAFRDGRLPQAMRLSKRARESAQQVLRLLQGPISRDAVRTALADTDAVIEDLKSAIDEAGSDATAGELLKKAERRQSGAKAQLADGHPRRALAQTRVARRLAQRGLKILAGE